MRFDFFALPAFLALPLFFDAFFARFFGAAFLAVFFAAESSRAARLPGARRFRAGAARRAAGRRARGSCSPALVRSAGQLVAQVRGGRFTSQFVVRHFYSVVEIVLHGAPRSGLTRYQ